MRAITSLEAGKTINILTESFLTNPSALWVIKQDRKVKRRLKTLIEYAVKTGLDHEGVFLSNDGSAAAICFTEPHYSSLKSYWHQFQLIRKAIGFSRVPYILKREGYLKKHRPNIPHLNFWFLGVDPSKKGGGGVTDIKKGIFDMSKQRQLPILIETSVERNKKVYEYFGFHTYHTWKYSSKYTLYFMRKDHT